MIMHENDVDRENLREFNRQPMERKPLQPALELTKEERHEFFGLRCSPTKEELQYLFSKYIRNLLECREHREVKNLYDSFRHDMNHLLSPYAVYQAHANEDHCTMVRISRRLYVAREDMIRLYERHGSYTN